MSSALSSPGQAPGTAPLVRLVRHGETADYHFDAGLTDTGERQARVKAAELAARLRPGAPVIVMHSPRARTRETAVLLVEGLRENGVAASLDPSGEESAFDNFRVAVGQRELEVTAAFPAFDLELRSGTALGHRPGWAVEVERFWAVQESGGDPIGHWITHPGQFLESASAVVHRVLERVASIIVAAPGSAEVIIATHSGPMRALIAYAFGEDPGEPRHLAEVALRPMSSSAGLLLRYDGRDARVDWPTPQAPTWFPSHSEAQLDHV